MASATRSPSLPDGGLPPPVMSDLPGANSAAMASPVPPCSTRVSWVEPRVSTRPPPQRVTRPSDWVAPPPRPLPDTPPGPPVRGVPLTAAMTSAPLSTGLHPLKPRTRPQIMDPPGTKISIPAMQSNGFPSPTIDHASANSKFVEDLARLTYAIHQSLGEAVRRVVRDNWEKCILGSDFHQAFILNASIHHASSAITKRSIRDFGSKMVKSSKIELAEHFTTADLDDVAHSILGKASERFLDTAMDMRLRTIEAKGLINALARAERLGYDSSDIEEDHSPPAPPPGYAVALPQHQPIARPPPPAGIPAPNPFAILQCEVCYRTFTSMTAFEYHTRKHVCTRTPPGAEGFKHSCPHCGQGFTTLIGMTYHLNKRVCGDFGETPASRNDAALAAATAAAAAAAAAATGNAGVGVIQPAPSSSQPAGSQGAHSTPVPVRTQPVAPSPRTEPPKAADPESHRKASGVDPYAHLTNAQRVSLNDELRQAEIAFAERFRAADLIADEPERRAKLEGLRNSFGTKQSMIRKKYGVRLRERRTKAEIQAERDRMGRSEPDSDRDNTSTQTPTTVPWKVSTQSAVSRPGSTAAAAPNPQPSPTISRTTANIAVKREIVDDSDSDPKRRKLENSNGYISPYVSASVKRPSAPISIRSSSSTPPSAQATTSQPVTTYEQAGALVSIHLPDRPSSSPGAHNPDGEADGDSNSSGRTASTEKPNPTEPDIPDDNEGMFVDENDDDNDEDSDDDDDDGIPATLPDAVRQTLTRTSRPRSAAERQGI